MTSFNSVAEADWDSAPPLLEGATSLELAAAQCNLKYWLGTVPNGTLRGHVHGHAPSVRAPSFMREAGPLADQNGWIEIPGVPAGTSTNTTSVSPSAVGIATLAESRSIDLDMLHGFFEPLITIPPSVRTPVTVGERMPWPGLPSAKPDETSSCWLATASSSAHSTPLERKLSANVKMLATEK